jgi:hypothetical protein
MYCLYFGFHIIVPVQWLLFVQGFDFGLSVGMIVLIKNGI